MHIKTARLLIGIVMVINVQCALAFMLFPGNFVAAYELEGAVGEAAVRGFGLLFLMWNVPYAVALWNPVLHRLSLYEALTMQSIGLVGEVFILSALPAVNQTAQLSIQRFIIFDGVGLVFLISAAIITRKKV